MSDLFGTGVQIPNIATGQSRPADAPSFIRIVSRGQRLFGRLFDGSEHPLTGLLLPEVENLIRQRRNVSVWSGSGAPVEIAGDTNWGVWHGAVGTSGGNVTFNVTKNGAAGGDPIFSNLASCIPQVTCLRDTASNSEAPWAHIRSTANNRTVNVQIKRSNTGGILIGGTYQGNADNSNGVTVYLTLHGLLA